MAQTHGKAGTTTYQKGDRLVQRTFAPIFVTGVLTYLFFHFGAKFRAIPSVVRIFFLGGLFLYCIERVYHLEVVANRYYNGAGGERLVGSILARLPDEFHVFNSLSFYAGDVDHVVVGPTGVFVIETKNYAGTITCREGHLCRNGDTLQRDFVRQVSSETMYVKGRLQPQSPCHVRSLVVFTKARVRVHTAVDGVRIVPVALLGEAILNRAPCLSEEEIATYAARLAGVSYQSAESSQTSETVSAAAVPGTSAYWERPGFIRITLKSGRSQVSRERRKTRTSLNKANSSRKTARMLLDGSKVRGVSSGGQL